MRRREFISLIAGAAATWPSATKAQQPSATPVIGYLHFGSPRPFAYQIAAFEQGLNETGYVVGKNVTLEYRWAEGHYDRLPALASDLVERKVNLIAAIGSPSALAAKNATQTIPIVFTTGVDPVADGLVASFARPGGNLTGISFLIGELIPKRLELLSELVPQARSFALLVNPNDANQWIGDVQKAARAKGVQLTILNASTESEIDTAFTTIAGSHVDALVVGDDPFFIVQGKQLVALASRHAVPTAYQLRELVVAGGLMSYGASITAVFRRAGIYTGNIIKGTKPADLPVQQPTKFELVVNRKTARALDISIPQILLATADEVIE